MELTRKGFRPNISSPDRPPIWMVSIFLLITTWSLRRIINSSITFYNRFQKEFGSVFCRDLVGYDLTDPNERKKARDSKVFLNKCVHFVEKAVDILIDLE